MSRRFSRKKLGQKNRVVLNVEKLEDRVTPSTITKTITLGPTLTNFQVQAALQQFDPSLGKLESAVITENGTISSTIQAENTSPVGNTITATVQGTFSLSAPGVSNDSLTVTGHPSQNSIPPYPFLAAANPFGDKSFTGPASVTWPDATATSATPNSYTITDPTLLSDYTGIGTVAVTESAKANSTADDTAGNITTNIVSNGTATITVTYTYQPPATSIAGFAYLQTMSPQVFTPGITPPLAGVIMTLTGGNLTTPLTTTTAADGSYSFNGLQSGTYTVTQTQPSGYLPGTITAGTDNGVSDGAAGVETISNITVNDGDPGSIENNFGELPPVKIAGVTYIQTTNPEAFLPGTTPPLGGVTLTLTGGNLTTPLTTTSASDGTYAFTGLKPGTYTVTQTQPTAYLPGTITAGTDNGTTDGAVGTETISQITLNPGDSSINNNFGELVEPAISGFVYYEPNAPTQVLYQDNVSTPGIAGVTVTLTGSDGSTKTTTTAQDGSYSFTPLTPGVSYSVAINHPNGYLVGTDTAGSAGGTVSTTSEKITAVTVAGGAMATGYNFGEIKPSSLAGNVYVDAQNDGQLDPGDPPIGNDTITLTGFNDQGPVSEMTTTASDGTYSFTNLRPGTYGITQTQPAGYIQAATTVGSQGGTETPGDISNISLTENINGINNNFGELQPPTPGTPLPKVTVPFGVIPGISKAQMTSDPSWANVDPAMINQMAQVVATTMTLTGQQLNINGVAAGVQTLNSSGFGGFVNQVWYSNAHLTAEVNSAYKTVLNRAPTAAELSAGIGQLTNGASTTTLLVSLYTSQAFQALHPTNAGLVAALYQGILNTTPGSVATSSMVQSLATQPLSAVVQNLMSSTAALDNQIDNAYLLVLRRNPSATETQYWLPQLQSGALTIDQLTQKLLSTQEFSALAYANVT